MNDDPAKRAHETPNLEAYATVQDIADFVREAAQALPGAKDVQAWHSADGGVEYVLPAQA